MKRALPHAIQVADRYHLFQNLREHLQRFLDHRRTYLAKISDTPLKEAQTCETNCIGPADISPGEAFVALSERSQTDASDQQAGTFQVERPMGAERSGGEDLFLDLR